MTPFVKWVGGKRGLLPSLLAAAPKSFKRYHEPFVGGGALFFQLQTEGMLKHGATLSDNNRRLVHAYVGVRDEVEHVIRLLQTYPHEKQFYWRMRSEMPDDKPHAEIAAWLIYLNRTGYNGLYRVNRRNIFNVPFGNYKDPKICDAENLRACSAALGGTEILAKSFETIEERAEKGDFVYFDPPYVPVSETSSFTSYTAEGFGPTDQERLAQTARRLKARGVHVLLSNSDSAVVRSLYKKDFELREVLAARSVNSRADRRGKVKELLISG